jgi:hypothetical protein
LPPNPRAQEPRILFSLTKIFNRFLFISRKPRLGEISLRIGSSHISRKQLNKTLAILKKKPEYTRPNNSASRRITKKSNIFGSYLVSARIITIIYLLLKIVFGIF